MLVYKVKYYINNCEYIIDNVISNRVYFRGELVEFGY